MKWAKDLRRGIKYSRKYRMSRLLILLTSDDVVDIGLMYVSPKDLMRRVNDVVLAVEIFRLSNKLPQPLEVALDAISHTFTLPITKKEASAVLHLMGIEIVPNKVPIDEAMPRTVYH